MAYGYLDIEFNSDEDRKPGENDIIEISFVSGKINYSTFIKPRNRPVLTPYIKNLTGITQEQVNKGISFPDALSDILDIIHEHQIQHVFVWGSKDKETLLDEQKRWSDQVSPAKIKVLTKRIHDLSMVFKIWMDKNFLSINYSLHEALYVFGLPDLVEHESLSDAKQLMDVHQAYMRAKPPYSRAINRRREEVYSYRCYRRALQVIRQSIQTLNQNEDGEKRIKNKYPFIPSSQIQPILEKKLPIQTLEEFLKHPDPIFYNEQIIRFAIRKQKNAPQPQRPPLRSAVLPKNK